MVRSTGVFVGEGENNSLNFFPAFIAHAQKNAFSKSASFKRTFWFFQLNNSGILERMSTENVFYKNKLAVLHIPFDCTSIPV